MDYLTAFCSNDVSGVEATLGPEFELVGPLFTFESKQDYLSSLANSPAERARFDLIDVLESKSTVSVFYDYRKPSGTVTVAQLFWLRDSKIVKTLLVFDTTRVKEPRARPPENARAPLRTRKPS